MKILVTGASGFIGSFIVEEALNRGEVWAGLRASSSKKYLPFQDLKFVDIPYAKRDEAVALLREHKEMFGKWDVIIHNMGLTKCKHVSDFDRVNFEYTKNFIEALIEADMVPNHFVYMSSLSAFGPGDPKSLAELKLDDEPKPNTAYGLSKLKTERYLRSLHNFPYTILRPTGVYGPREKDYFVMLQTLSRHLNPAIGFKPQFITFIYVKDLVKTIFLCVEKGAIGKEYFVADGDVWNSDDYTKVSMEKLGVNWAVPVRVPCFLVKAIAYALDTVCGWFGITPTLNKDKYNILSARNWKCDIEPLKNDLGFKADYPLDRGLEECIEWYRKEGWL